MLLARDAEPVRKQNSGIDPNSSAGQKFCGVEIAQAAGSSGIALCVAMVGTDLTTVFVAGLSV